MVGFPPDRTNRRGPISRAGARSPTAWRAAGPTPDRGAPRGSPPRPGGPTVVPDERVGQLVGAEEPDVGGLERVGLELASGGDAMEDDRVERDAGEAHPHPVEHRQHPDGLALDARLLVDLLDRHLGGAVPDVGPSGRVEPHARVGSLHQQQPTVLVADDRADGDLRRDVARDALADEAHPLVDAVGRVEVVGLGVTCDVGRNVQDLGVPLTLVEALGEPESGSGDRLQLLGPVPQMLRRGRTVAFESPVHRRRRYRRTPARAPADDRSASPTA